MLRGSLCLMHRALREDMRTFRSHGIRVGLLVAVFASLISVHRESWIFGAPGLRFFEMITWVDWVCITIAGISFFSSAVTEEKEEMTLGLLRMAGITPLALLIGKTAPRVLTALVLLTIQFPFTLLAITLGGVSLRQAVATYIALIAYTLMMAGIALLVSVVCRRSTSAAWMTAVILFFLSSIPPMIYGVILDLDAGGVIDTDTGVAAVVTSATEVAIHTSVWRRINTVVATGFGAPVIDRHTWVSVGLGGLLFLLAWAGFERYCGNELPVHPLRASLSRRIGGWFGPRRVGGRPIVWKDFYFIAGGRTLIALKLIVIPLLAVLSAFGVDPVTMSEMTGPKIGAHLMAVAFFVLLFEPALHAGRIFREEWQWKTLSTLMLLPASTPAIVYAKVRAGLLAVATTVGLFVVGMAMNAIETGSVIEEFLNELEHSPEMFFFFLMLFAQHQLFVHLSAYLSLYIRWGAVGVSAGIVIIGFMLFMSIFIIGMSSTDAAPLMFLNAMVAGAAVCYIHAAIGKRLSHLAAT